MPLAEEVLRCYKEKGQTSTYTCEGYTSPQDWVKRKQMPSHSVLPFEPAQPDTTGFAHTGGSRLSHCNIKTAHNAERQSCWLNQDAALLSSGIRPTPRQEWPCLSARLWVAGNRAKLRCADLSAPQVPSAVPQQGFLRTMSSGYVWL